jgi:hypothetical protein
LLLLLLLAAVAVAATALTALPFLPLLLFLFNPMLFVILKFFTVPLKRFVLLASKPANTRYVAVRAFLNY